MNEVSQTLKQATLKGSTNATFSLVLADGHTPFDLQVGQTIDLFGPDHHLASLSVLQVTEKEKTTNATSGQSFSNSLTSANLQQSLVNKLQARLETVGSTIYKLTWKEKTTPAGWSFFQRVASAPRTNATGYSSWPTPAARDYKGANSIPNTIKKVERGQRAHMGQLANFAPVMLSNVEMENLGIIPTESEIFPLANGVPNRVGILRGAGNAIVPQVAAEVIKSFMEIEK